MEGSLSRALVVALSAGSLLAYALRRRRCARVRPAGKALAVGGISGRFANAVTAVRGKLTLKANAYREQLAAGKGAGLPFTKVVECNIGNPQALGQRPLTFVRQVLSLLDYPPLVDHPDARALFPEDVRQRARELLAGIPGGVGAYSESQGALYVRQACARFIAARDGHAADPADIFLTDGASEAVKMCLQVCLRHAHDAILVPIPQYPLYSGSINLFGGQLCGYFLDEEHGWALTASEVQRALDDARAGGKCVRALVVINPGNPTGNTLALSDQQAIVELCARENIVLLADEVYARRAARATRAARAPTRTVSPVSPCRPQVSAEPVRARRAVGLLQARRVRDGRACVRARALLLSLRLERFPWRVRKARGVRRMPQCPG